jgi:hypothetical protein
VIKLIKMKFFFILFVKIIMLFTISTADYSEKFPLVEKRIKLKCLIPVSRLFGKNVRCTKIDAIKIDATKNPLYLENIKDVDYLAHADDNQVKISSAKNYIRLKQCILNKKLC